MRKFFKNLFLYVSVFLIGVLVMYVMSVFLPRVPEWGRNLMHLSAVEHLSAVDVPGVATELTEKIEEPVSSESVPVQPESAPIQPESSPVVPPEVSRLCEAWEKSKENFEIFQNEEVKKERTGRPTEKFGQIICFELATSFTTDDYDKMCAFLEAMQNLVDSQKQPE